MLISTFQTSDGNFTKTLDLIFTDLDNRIDIVEPSPSLGGLLEKALLVLNWDYNLRNEANKVPEYSKLKFLYKKGDFKKLSEFIDNPDWVKIFENKSVQENYSNFLNIYNEACERFIPKVNTGNFKAKC